VEERPKYRRAALATKLTPFRDAIALALLADARRPKHRPARGMIFLSKFLFSPDFCGHVQFGGPRNVL